MPESLRTRSFRWMMNWFPAYRGSGARVTYIADDWKEIRVKLPLNWRTRNYVGTIFGGSLYAAVDPMYMLMLMKLLGPDYIVWDKAATIRFKRPGKGKLTARFRIDDAEIERIKSLLAEEESVDRVYDVCLVDGEGSVCVEVEKTVYVRVKDSSPSREASNPTANDPDAPAV